MNRILLALALPLLILVSGPPAGAADHGDSPLLTSIPRHDARITDLHVFTAGDRLVLSLCTNPAVPPGLTRYTFPSDLTLRMHIDNHSRVSFDDPVDLHEFGGTLIDPGQVSPDIVLEFAFDEDGEPRLRLEGLPASAAASMQVFAGLRDDPFIRGPRIGRNVAAIVVELPLSVVQGESGTLLVWATSKVPEVRGMISEHAGRALRSMFSEEDVLNTTSPRNQFRHHGLRPDVVIFDTARPAVFPNGRGLLDDIVDMMAIESMLNTDAPYPSENDMGFLDHFPYLAPPQ